jgi:hypothetical protein
LKDQFVAKNESKVLENVARMSGMTQETVQNEILRRKKILEWLRAREIFDYNEVSRIITDYYTNEEKVMSFIEESA